MPCSPDLFVLGFQEIVPLTAQQIIQTDPEKKCANDLFARWIHLEVSNRCMWENVIMDTLARRPNKKEDYVILRSEQV